MGIPWGVWKSTLKLAAFLFATSLLGLAMSEIIGPLPTILITYLFVYGFVYALSTNTNNAQ